MPAQRGELRLPIRQIRLKRSPGFRQWRKAEERGDPEGDLAPAFEAGNGSAESPFAFQTLEGLEQTLEGLEQNLEGAEQTLEGLEQNLEGAEQNLEGLEQTLEGAEQNPRVFFQTLEGTEQTLRGFFQIPRGLERISATQRRRRLGR